MHCAISAYLEKQAILVFLNCWVVTHGIVTKRTLRKMLTSNADTADHPVSTKAAHYLKYL